jgi:uncharacterized protein (TIGR03437 family)
MPAQTSAVAHLAVQSGNGQVYCQVPACTLQEWQPISVMATNATGSPVSGATVNWSLTGGDLTLGGATSVTGTNGIATETLSQSVSQIYASAGESYVINTIQATSNNQSVVFTETRSLLNETSPATEIQANSPTLGGQFLSTVTLREPVGTIGPTPIQVQVAGLDIASNGVANVSVRLVNEQSSPTLTCESQGGYADPGSVLTNSLGIASCTPIYSGSGSGTFYVIVGGVPATDISTAYYLDAFPLPSGAAGGYSFTSVPGTPATFQIIGGNNQVGAIGQTLQPLIAKLVDANGNPVQGQTVKWTVVPAGAVALSNQDLVTDNNGEVSQTVSLYLPASAGAAITVTLVSNPSISATFQETVQGVLTALNIVSGNPQTAQVGTAFTAPLVVQLLNASGPVANYPVQFQFTGPVILSATTVGTAANGQASVNVTAGQNAGTATVTAVAGALTAKFTLTVTSTPTGPTPNGITIVSGNNQTAQMGVEFSQPLVVQVNSASGPVPGVSVIFTPSGPISLSAPSVTTNSSGQASVNATAGNASGAGSVTASITGYQASFSLTVMPPGPQITASSFLNAASRQVGALSPCSLAIISAPGLTPDGTADYTLAPITGRYPVTVHGLSVTFGGTAAPIVSVAMGATYPEVTLQVPCEVTPASSVPVLVTVNGGANATADIPIYAASPGIFQAVMSDGNSRAVAVRSDGTFADIGQYPPNPVRLNEVVRFYVTGLGSTNPTSVTDTLEDPNSYVYNGGALQNFVTGAVQMGFPGTGILLQNVSAHQAPGLIGVYEVQAFIPPNSPTGDNVQIYIGITPSGSTASPTLSPYSTIPIGQ